MGWEKKPKEKNAHEWGIDCKLPEGKALDEHEAGDVFACEDCGARHQLTDVSQAADDKARGGWLRLPRE